MPRLKYFNQETGKWEYADSQYSVNSDVNIDLTDYAKTSDIPTDEHINSLIDTKLEDFDVPEGGGDSSRDFTEIFRLETTEEVGLIQTGLNLSEYKEIVALCECVPVEGTTSTTHFSWYASGNNPMQISNSLHNTQRRIHAFHGTRIKENRYFFRIYYGMGYNYGLLNDGINSGSPSSGTNAAGLSSYGYGVVIDHLTDNFRFGSYGGTVSLAIGAKAVIYGRK